MFDPHRTRRSNSRYFTRKGQVIQASRVDVSPVIDQRLVPLYQNYIVKNGLLDPPPPPTPSTYPITSIKLHIPQTVYEVNLSEMQVSTEPSFVIQGNTTRPNQALIVLSEDENGNHNFGFNCFAAQGAAYNFPVSNNVKCYYTLLQIDARFVGGSTAFSRSLMSNGNTVFEYKIFYKNEELIFLANVIPISI